jgi:selenocysteine lyase/cysteine desulfurase
VIQPALVCQRERFSIPAGHHYLNCAYMAPFAREVEEAGERAIRRRRGPFEITAPDFFRDADAARERFARIIGSAQARRVAIIPAVSYGIALVARNTQAERGQNVVLAAEQFPSNVYAWRRLARERGLHLRTVAAPGSAARAAEWNDSLLDAIDRDTAVVALPHVHWTDGTRFDLVRIGARARELGAALVVDATQSVGALPFDQARIQADAIVCAAYKWLLGPYGIGLAWLGPRFDDAEPLEDTWIGREGSEDFRGLVLYNDAFQPGAARFDVGERGNFLLLPMLVAALDLVLEWTPARIQAWCASLAAPAIDAAADLGFQVQDAGARGAHLFGLRAPEGLDLEVLQARLRERNVHVALRGSAMRVSPHVYNDARDIEAMVGALRASVSAGSRAVAP